MWADLDRLPPPGQGTTVWYNVLPPYVGKKSSLAVCRQPGQFRQRQDYFHLPDFLRIGARFQSDAADRFQLRENYKGNTGMETDIPFKASMVLHPSAFVFLSESRTHASESHSTAPAPPVNWAPLIVATPWKVRATTPARI